MYYYFLLLRLCVKVKVNCPTLIFFLLYFFTPFTLDKQYSSKRQRDARPNVVVATIKSFQIGVRWDLKCRRAS